MAPRAPPLPSFTDQPEKDHRHADTANGFFHSFPFDNITTCQMNTLLGAGAGVDSAWEQNAKRLEATLREMTQNVRHALLGG